MAALVSPAFAAAARVWRASLGSGLDVFNILNANSNTLESDLSGPAFLTRVPLGVEAPRTARLGVEWKFSS